MIVTTTPTLEGYTIKEYKGIVSGEVIFGMNFVIPCKLFRGQRFKRWNHHLQE